MKKRNLSYISLFLATVVLLLSLAVVLSSCTVANTDGETENESFLPSETEPSATEGNVYYTVTVVDENNSPVSGARVQMCKGDLCFMPEITDKDGNATFELEEYNGYKAYVSKADGYLFSNEYSHFDINEQSLTIIVQSQPPESSGTQPEEPSENAPFGSVIVVTDRDFEEEVLNYNGVVMVKFGATWCPPCQAMAPVLEEFAEENPYVKVVDVDVDNCPVTTTAYDIYSIPETIIFKNGQIHDRIVGAISKDKMLELVTAAQELPDVQQAESSDTEPTQLSETQSTEPSATQPTEPAETQPTEPAETQTTEPAETQPTEPAETQPTEPAETQPTEPSEIQPEEPSENAPFGSVIVVTDSNFDEEVLNYEGVVMVKFGATWCPPCQAMAPVLEEFAEENPYVKVVDVDVDNCPVTTAAYDIYYIPETIIFKNGQIHDRIVGAITKDKMLELITAAQNS